MGERERGRVDFREREGKREREVAVEGGRKKWKSGEEEEQREVKEARKSKRKGSRE